MKIKNRKIHPDSGKQIERVRKLIVKPVPLNKGTQPYIICQTSKRIEGTGRDHAFNR